jgi:V8-like Glu-specific endopeptidase
MNRFRAFFIAPIAILIALTLPAVATASGPVELSVDRPAAKVLEYWTPARMRAAEPVPVETGGEPDVAPSSAAGTDSAAPTYVPPAAPGPAPGARLLHGATTEPATARHGRATPVADPSAPGIHAHGKVFFTLEKLPESHNDFVCSGTAVNSRNRSVVVTAGHCVYDVEDGAGKATNFIFVPAYDNHDTPYGVWAAKSLSTTRQWKKAGNLRYDLGAAVVRRDHGRRLQSVIGARGIGFNQPRDQSFDIFGYPAQSPFNGEREYRCASNSKGSDSPGGRGPNTMRVSCDMTPGSSGGGWIVGDRTLVSVTSYSYTPAGEYNPNGKLYGPYLSTTAKKLYKSVKGRKGKKHRR